jgi:YidC/Oxa1 family membrane protein insertase
MGGCLPIAVQVPVFFSLYKVLLMSIEMRHTPFIFWIHDLSAQDPYYVLPVLMGISMFVQQKLNPPQADPMMAKMMQFLPLLFTTMFLFFPSGLVIYWVVSNVLSITQQYYVMRKQGALTPA